nr:integrase, catalytic region, zinc finger, CCHC-type, peptidase aspartic, catalytic [Tanacetum cinerariifolium]
MDINIDALYNILKKNQGDVNDAIGLKKKTVVVTFDPLALIAEKTKVSKRKEKVVVSLDSEGSDADNFSELKKITVFNKRKFYSKLTNNNLRTPSTSESANKKQVFVKLNDKKVEKKDDEKKRDMSKVKCYNCKKEGHFVKDCKKVKVKDYKYYKTKMLLTKKDKDELVLLAEDQALMELSSDSDQEINEDMVFMTQIEEVLSDSEASSSFADDKISKVSYYLSESKSESEYETSKYYDNTTTYGLFVHDNRDQKNFLDCENFLENLIEYQIDHNESAVDHNDYEGINKVEKCVTVVKEIQVVYVCRESESVSNGDLDALSSVRRPKSNGVMWMREGSSNTVKADLSSVNHFNLNKNVKRYPRKNLMACNNFDTCSAFDCNNARNTLCNARMNASVNVNDLFVFDDVSIRKSHVSKMPFRKKPRDSLNIIDLRCSKHMTVNLALLTSFVEKFLGTVLFGNNDFAVIAGYGDVVIGSMTIKKVYYVEGLGHNLFSVGQFCDKVLKVAFRKSTCFVQTENGVDLLTGDRSSNLYTIALNEVASNSSIYLLAKAFSSQSWLWHQRLSHLNFTTINNLMKNNLVQGLPKMKFKKDHLCSACEQGKIRKKHHKGNSSTQQWEYFFTRSGKITLAVGTSSSSGNFFWQWEFITESRNILEHCIPNNPSLNLMLHLQSSF